MSTNQKSFDDNDHEIYIEKKLDNDIERLKLNLAPNFVKIFYLIKYLMIIIKKKIQNMKIPQKMKNLV